MAGVLIPLGDIILPGILWLAKKDKIAGLEKQGKNLLVSRIIFDIALFAFFSVAALDLVMEQGDISPTKIAGIYKISIIVYALFTILYPLFAAIYTSKVKKIKSFYPIFMN